MRGFYFLPRAVALGALSCLGLLFGPGCGRQPEVAKGNRDLVESLVTAVSARNSDWLEKNAQSIEKKRSAGDISDAEYQSFSKIVAQARAGDWKAAETAAYALREAQTPTSEDLRDLEQRKLGPDHGLRPPGATSRGH